jgi:hypothetical protein
VDWTLKMPQGIQNLLKGFFATPEEEQLICIPARALKRYCVASGHRCL